MSARREKKKRRVEKRIYRVDEQFYNMRLSLWESKKPPRWRIFKYKKWLKLKPRVPKGCK